MWKKLKSKKAETLLETLISMLIAVLSVTLLTSSVMAAARINKTTKDADATYQAELAEAETAGAVDTTNSDPKITITFADGSSESVDIIIYGTGDYASYEKEVAP